MHEPVTEVRGSQIRRLQLVELSLSNIIRVNEFKQTPFFRGIMQIFLDKLDAKLCLRKLFPFREYLAPVIALLDDFDHVVPPYRSFIYVWGNFQRKIGHLRLRRSLSHRTVRPG